MDKQKILISSTDLIVKDLSIQGIEFVGIIIYDKDRNIVYYKNSNDKWSDFYLSSNNVTDKCHLKEIGYKILETPDINHASLSWDSCIPTNDESYYLNEKRIKYSVSHGYSIFHKLPNNSVFVMSLATAYKNFNFVNKVIENKSKIFDIVNHNLNRIICPK